MGFQQKKPPHLRLQTTEGKIIRQGLSEMENTATRQALQHEKCWSFQPFCIFFKKDFHKTYGNSPGTTKDKSKFLFPSTKDQTILCVTQVKEKI